MMGTDSHWSVFVYQGRVPEKAKAKALAESGQRGSPDSFQRRLWAIVPAAPWTRFALGALRGATRSLWDELLDNRRVGVTCQRGHREQLARSQVVRLAERARAADLHEISSR
jgi:hypothetical protein